MPAVRGLEWRIRSDKLRRPSVGNTKGKPLELPDPIIESVITYVHWLDRGTLSLIRVAASDGFIPSDAAIDELFRKIVAPHSALIG